MERLSQRALTSIKEKKFLFFGTIRLILVTLRDLPYKLK